MQASPVLSLCPSFDSYYSEESAEIAAENSVESKDSVSDKVMEEEEPHDEESLNDELQEQKHNEAEEDEDEEFEFAFVCKNPDGSPISADEIFYNGQIRPIFPIFNRDLLFAGGHDDDSKLPDVSSLRLPLRKLLIEERDPPSSSSSEADDLERVPDGAYCVWRPKVEASQERCKKSNSTGSSKGWRFRDLLHRSHSDGKDAFVFLSSATASTQTKKTDEKAEAEVSKETRKSGEVKTAGKVKGKGVNGEKVSAHEIHYVRNRALKEGDRRRSYLPYRQDLVGFFTNVNGLSRNIHPF
ncbi:hypothetical protein HHK36_024942 [Tetracentron sinense]|uniref:Uncharacterized protein n=1 Tax=Tetracentron sinense TaxID=13715 RepID=A0A834YP30_TETSI|nr:hypothetical protein HHK36_024942 [Tetracentron sinense]